MNPIKARVLRRGDTISVIAPAGPVDRGRVERALDRLRALGYRLKTHGDIFRARGYLAGDDETRALEIMDAFADPESTAVWCARGGYGIVRLLERLDYDVIRCHPKVFVGFSDITALHLAIQNRTGLVTFHGPNLQDGFGAADGMSATTEAALWRAISADAPSVGQGDTLAESGVGGVTLRALSPGVASGRITGGNLSVLCGLVGTPFEIETAGRILFLEDVNEPLYRIDRYLAQLALAGKLREAAGILLGGFTFDQQSPAESDAALLDLFQEYFGGLSVPAVAGFPAGHQRENWAWPMNAMVDVNADAGRVRMLERPVVVIH